MGIPTSSFATFRARWRRLTFQQQITQQPATEASRIVDLLVRLEARANTAMDLFARVRPFVRLEYLVQLWPHSSLQEAWFCGVKQRFEHGCEICGVGHQKALNRGSSHRSSVAVLRTYRKILTQYPGQHSRANQ